MASANTARPDRLMAALLTASSLKQAAKQAGIPERTARTIASSEDFQARMAKHRQGLVNTAVLTAGSNIGVAFETLVDVMKDPEVSGGVRVMAADKLLLHLSSYLDRADILDRLSRLESAQGGVAGPLDAVGTVIRQVRG